MSHQSLRFGSKRGLPFLRLHDMVGVWGMKDEALELHLPETSEFRPSLESSVHKIADAVSALKKPNLGVEVGTDLSVFPDFAESDVDVQQSYPASGRWRSHWQAGD